MTGTVQYYIEEVLPTGKSPPPHSNRNLKSTGQSSCTQVGPKVFVVGKLNHPGNATIAVYDFQANEWKHSTHQGLLPRGIHGHTSFLLDDRLYLHGGRNVNYHPVSDLFYLDLVTLELIKCDESTENSRPSARYYHIGEYLERLRRFVVFGGYQPGEYCSDLWALRVEDHTWTKVEAKGKIPTDRNGHCSCAVGERIFVYGGNSMRNYEDSLHVLDCGRSSFVWSRVFVQLGLIRKLASLTYYNGMLLLIGGHSGTLEDTADVFVLQEPDFLPVKAERLGGGEGENGRYKCRGHTTIVSSGGLYLFDGFHKPISPLRLRIQT